MKKRMHYLLQAMSFIFLISSVQAQQLDWASKVGYPATNEFYTDISTDTAGNVYTLGQFSGTIDFDPGAGVFNLTSAGFDVFISKVDKNGNFISARGMQIYGKRIATDIAGNVYLTGSFSGNKNFDHSGGFTAYNSPGQGDIFLVKIGPSDNFIWAKHFQGGSNLDEPNSINVDDLGNIYLTGSFSDPVDFDPSAGTTILTPVGIKDIFVAKLNTNGGLVWAKSIGGINDEEGRTIAVDADYNVVVAGIFRDTIDFNPGAGTAILETAGMGDAFVCKFDSSGNFVWANGIGSFFDDQAVDIVVDAAGNIAAIGTFYGAVDFDPSPAVQLLTSAGNDGFLAKWSANGSLLWANPLSSAGVDASYSISKDSDDNLYLTGGYGGTTDFDPSANTYMVSGGPVVSKFQSDGALVWAKSIGTNGGSMIIEIDDFGDICMLGNFNSTQTLDFDPSPNTFSLTAGSTDVFTWKWLQCEVAGATLTPTACGSYTAPNGHIYNNTGSYTVLLPTSTGCDSVLTINLNITPINLSVTQNGNTLTANALGAAYQWIDCANNTIISGQTNQSFTPTASGNYAVIITENGCSDTSSCYNVIINGIDQISALQTFSIYPNPSNGTFQLVFDALTLLDNANVEIYTLCGEKIYQAAIRNTSTQINLEHPSSGIYFVKIYDNQTTITRKVIIN